MIPRTTRATVLAALSVIAAVPAASAARSIESVTLSPGSMLYDVCSSGYAPAAKNVPVSIDGIALEVRKVRKTASGQRVVFSHRVQVRDEVHHRIRLVINRGRHTVQLANECPAS